MSKEMRPLRILDDLVVLAVPCPALRYNFVINIHAELTNIRDSSHKAYTAEAPGLYCQIRPWYWGLWSTMVIMFTGREMELVLLNCRCWQRGTQVVWKRKGCRCEVIELIVLWGFTRQLICLPGEYTFCARGEGLGWARHYSTLSVKFS